MSTTYLPTDDEVADLAHTAVSCIEAAVEGDDPRLSVLVTLHEPGLVAGAVAKLAALLVVHTGDPAGVTSWLRGAVSGTSHPGVEPGAEVDEDGAR